MDKQDIPKKHRDLLLKIAHCEIANERLNNLLQGIADDHPCTSICDYQCTDFPKKTSSKQKFTKAMFHVPEPWSGNLKTAEILFVGSNPSIDLKEKLFPKFESQEWSEDKKNEVVNFFSTRLNKLENLNSDYWTEILKYAEYILKVTDPSRALDKENDEDKKRKSLLA